MSEIDNAILTLKVINVCGSCATGADKKGGCAECERRKAKKQAIQALEEKQQREWIPVSDRLPEKGGYYLVSTKFETPRVMLGYYYPVLKKWNYWMSNLEIASVIAWKQLPTPYKENL